MEKERKLDQFLQYTVEIGEIKFQMVDLLFILCLSVVGLLIRIPLYPITSADYLGCLLPWTGGDPADRRVLFLKSFDFELHIALYVSDVPCIICD